MSAQTLLTVVDSMTSPDAPPFNRWPCPGCGTRRPFDDVEVLDLADVLDGRNRRQVVVCACAALVRRSPRLRSRDHHDGPLADAR